MAVSTACNEKADTAVQPEKPDTTPRTPEPPPLAFQPNIVFILTDDQDVASVEVMTRVKEQLAAHGTTFRNSFVTQSQCCPARATILRGQYPHNHEVYSNDGPVGGFPKFHAKGHEASTFATWLQAAGYRTGLFGKYLNQYPVGLPLSYRPGGWDSWASGVGAGLAGNFGYDLNINGQLVHFFQKPSDYQTDVLATKMFEFIRSSATEGKPFFAQFSPHVPHEPSVPAPRHKGRFATRPLPRPPSFNEADLTDKPLWVRLQRKLTDADIAAMETHYRARLETLLAVDEVVGMLIDSLTALGQLDRTFIVFTSDNGYRMGEHGLAEGKGAPYEEDIRVPLIVRGPGVPSGITLDHMVLNNDLAPTFAEWGKAQIPAFVDGRSLARLLRDSPPPLSQWRQAFLIVFNLPHPLTYPASPGSTKNTQWLTGAPLPARFSAIRTADYMMAVYSHGEEKPDFERELYDLRNDPWQLNNIITQASPTLIDQLYKQLYDLKQCAGQACRMIER